ncbi:MAG: Do family serine endopeptidase [Tannerellaceae bacterium]|jgi:Do/DeqQ family serine protease|nr:Do family serine endopeptidase [Tannerellaceae bacterium]
MNNTMKSVLKGVVLVALSAGIAVVACLWIVGKKEKMISGTMNEYGFIQQSTVLRTVGLPPSAENIDFTEAAERTIHAVVHIKSVAKQQGYPGNLQLSPFEYFFGFGGGELRQPQPRVGAGSGVIISTDGYVMTNNHVIEGADELEVTLNDNRKFTALVVGADPTTDIALLKIEASDLPTIPFGNSENLKVGEWVLAVGNPFNLTSTVTAGIVSAKGRGGITRTGGNIESFIQTDAAVNPGNSGGALVNTRGELVGINTAIYSETGNFTGYSFAVPVTIAGKVVADLKEFGTVQRGFLGVQMTDVQFVPEGERRKLKVLEGAFIADFSDRSAAREAGIEKGDVIVEVNGVTIKSGNALQEQVNKYRPGDKVKVTVDRYGVVKTYTVTLRNMQGGTSMVKKKEDVAEVLGAAFRELPEKQRRLLGLNYGIEVVAVSSGKLKEVGIIKGYIILRVNEQPVSTPDELESVVEKLLKNASADKVLFIKGIYPNGRAKYYAIDLTSD